MLVIGLTGGIGTGKTQVSKILQELGADVIDADLLGHQVYRPRSEAWCEVVEAFGDGVLASDGEVDRKKLGAIVFNDPDAQERLDAITHPRIYRMLEERIERLRVEGTQVVVVEVVLLLEANWTALFDQIWVTTSTEEQVLRRLGKRDGLDESSIRARIRSQMPQDERVKRADVVIDNRGSPSQLRDRVQELWSDRASALKERMANR